jgi:hypothetical protein
VIPSSLPTCNCHGASAPYGHHYSGVVQSITKCGLHEIARQVLAECQSLMKQRGKLEGDLRSFTATIIAKTRSELLNGKHSGLAALPRTGGNDGFVSLESELNKATWIRPVCNSQTTLFVLHMLELVLTLLHPRKLISLYCNVATRGCLVHGPPASRHPSLLVQRLNPITTWPPPVIESPARTTSACLTDSLKWVRQSLSSKQNPLSRM